MSLDTLIFWIVVAIVVIFQIRKIKASRKPDRTKQQKKPTGWKAAIGDLIANVQTEMEKARVETEAKSEAGQPRPDRKTGWEDLIPTERYQPESLEDGRRPEAIPAAPEEEPLPWPMESEADMELTPTERMRAQRAKSAAHRTIARGKGSPPWRDRSRFTVRQLRHAVIWSEILAPPVGLRDTDQ